MKTYSDLTVLNGKIIKEILTSYKNDQILLNTIDGKSFWFGHCQERREHVRFTERQENLENFAGALINEASLKVIDSGGDRNNKHFTKTKLLIFTDRGQICFEWLGESNGYYEGIDFMAVN